MKSPIHFLVFISLILGGCVANLPFYGAELGRRFTLEEFEEALIAEKIGYLELEISNLKSLEFSPDAAKLVPFPLRQYPTLVDWRRMKNAASPGDYIREFRHKDYGKYYDGPPDANQLGYALMRGDKIVLFYQGHGDYRIDL